MPAKRYKYPFRMQSDIAKTVVQIISRLVHERDEWTSTELAKRLALGPNIVCEAMEYVKDKLVETGVSWRSETSSSGKTIHSFKRVKIDRRHSQFFWSYSPPQLQAEEFKARGLRSTIWKLRDKPCLLCGKPFSPGAEVYSSNASCVGFAGNYAAHVGCVDQLTQPKRQHTERLGEFIEIRI